MIREMSAAEVAAYRMGMEQLRAGMTVASRNLFDCVLIDARVIADCDREAFYALMQDAANFPKIYGLPEAPR